MLIEKRHNEYLLPSLPKQGEADPNTNYKPLYFRRGKKGFQSPNSEPAQTFTAGPYHCSESTSLPDLKTIQL